MTSLDIRTLTSTEGTGDDFIDSFQLPARFADSHVEHTHRIPGRSRELRSKIQVQRWKREREIGRGGFGVVYLEREEQTADLVRAVKVVPKRVGRNSTPIYIREVLAMAHFSQDEDLFVKLGGWYQDSEQIYIAMEYFELGNLDDCVTAPLPEREVQSISRQILEGLSFMHGKNFTHRDLKPDNIFVKENAPNWWVKLGDFGVSKRVRHELTSMHTLIETDWTAPEIVGFVDMEDETSSYTNAVDMWSLGCLVNWLFTKELPIPRRNMRKYCMDMITQDTTRLTNYGVSDYAVDFISKLIRPQPHERLPAAAALKHIWAQEVHYAPTANLSKIGEGPRMDEDWNKRVLYRFSESRTEQSQYVSQNMQSTRPEGAVSTTGTLEQYPTAAFDETWSRMQMISLGIDSAEARLKSLPGPESSASNALVTGKLSTTRKFIITTVTFEALAQRSRFQGRTMRVDVAVGPSQRQLLEAVGGVERVSWNESLAFTAMEQDLLVLMIWDTTNSEVLGSAAIRIWDVFEPHKWTYKEIRQYLPVKDAVTSEYTSTIVVKFKFIEDGTHDFLRPQNRENHVLTLAETQEIDRRKFIDARMNLGKNLISRPKFALQDIVPEKNPIPVTDLVPVRADTLTKQTMFVRFIRATDSSLYSRSYFDGGAIIEFQVDSQKTTKDAFGASN